MRVAIVAPSPVPFRRGGAERMWDGLLAHLRDSDHDAELIKLPVREFTLPDLVRGYRAFAALDLSHFDVVISGKYPAWAISHPAHVVWMLHPLRGLYDSWDDAAFADRRLPAEPAFAEAVRLLADPPERQTLDDALETFTEVCDLAGAAHPAMAIPSVFSRAVVHRLDRLCLRPSRIRRHAAISRTVAERPGYFPAGTRVEVAFPPSSLPVAPPVAKPSDFLVVSRLEQVKRVDLAIEAFRRVPGEHRLVIAGEGPDRERLEQLARGDRGIEFAGRVDDPTLATLYANARAVVVTPRHEDLGLVAYEAMRHGRPVITTTDSGGVIELVTDQLTGIVAEPEATALADAMGELARNRGRADQLGEAGRQAAAEITWAKATSVLLAPRRRARGERPKLVIAGTYPIHPRDKGGSIRCAELYRHLAEVAEVRAVTLSPTEDTECLDREIDRRFAETSVALSARHADAEARLRLVSGAPSITDIAASRLARATPRFVQALDAELDDATAVLLAHPYLVHLVRELRDDLPLIYDAHNDEAALKRSLLPATPGGRWLLEQAEWAEQRALDLAAMVSVTTEVDGASLRARSPGLQPVLAPNGVDCARITPPSRVGKARARAAVAAAYGLDPRRVWALFVGSAHQPNVEAARRLIGLAERVSDTDFLLVGSHADHVSGGPDTVHLVGHVDPERHRELLAAADLAINPVTGGSGSNLKIVEYFAAGIPVVTTPEGARGIDGADAVAIVRSPSDLATGIAEAIGDPASARERAERARDLAAAAYDWNAIGKRFTAAVVEALDL